MLLGVFANDAVDEPTPMPLLFHRKVVQKTDHRLFEPDPGIAEPLR